MPPMVPPAAMSGNSRLPSDSVITSAASDQNCAIENVLKMPSHTKNTKPTPAPERPSTKNAARHTTNTPMIQLTSRAGSMRLAR